MFNPANEVSSINFSAIIGGALNAVVNAQKESAETTVNFVRRVGFKPGPVDDKGREQGIGDPICVSFAYDKEVSPAHTTDENEYRVEIKNGGTGFKNADNIVLSVGEGDKKITLKAKIALGDDGKITGVTLLEEPRGEAVTDGAKITPTETDNDKISDDVELVLKVTKAGSFSPALYQKMHIDVPILTMLPIPFIKIDNTDIEFNVKINSVSTTESKDTTNSDLKSNSNFGYKGWGFNASTTLNTSISNQKSTSSNETVKKDYSLNIKVHAVQDDMPAGMSRILDILEESITTKAVTAPLTKDELKDKKFNENGEEIK